MVDDEDIWGKTDDIHNQEWNKLDNDFTNAGYREGITAGKENSLQEGFDEGFATVGVPLGRGVGKLRGIASACIALLTLSGQSAAYPPLTELQNILQCLNQLRFKDLVSPDLQAEDHMKEHLQSDETLSTTAGEEEHDKAINTLEDCKTRLQRVVDKLGLQSIISRITLSQGSSEFDPKVIM